MGYLYLEGEYERMVQLIKAGLDKENRILSAKY